MKADRLTHLMTQLDSGEITGRELDELESLLANDYESRERFLDHAQVEGLLHAVGGDALESKVVSLEMAEVPKDTSRKTSAKWTMVAALALGGVAVWWQGVEQSGSRVALKPPVKKEETKLSADERYQMLSASEISGASNVHPETAHLKGGARAYSIEFNRDVRPILSDKCVFCHGPDAETREADLRLDTEEGALGSVIIAGNADASELVQRIFHEDHDEVMPPLDSSRTLTAAEKQTLKKWIEQGAVWQKHWAFEPPKAEAGITLSAANIEHRGNEVDHFVERQLLARQMDFSAMASKETLIRRLSLDLTGLPPTLSEVEAFLADDSEKAYEKEVDRLLNSPRYAERMTWQWLEASRYADTDGYQNDGPRSMWRWRDWVIDAYADNKPFDQFTIEQLAGDLLPNPTQAQLIATGFNRNHRYNSESGLVLEEFLLENAVDRVDTSSTVWMGVTMACSRCHDHKYDPFSQKEYYQLISYFDAVAESGRAIKFGNSEPWIKAPTQVQEVKLAELNSRVKQAEAELASFNKEITALVTAQEKVIYDQPIVSQGLDFYYGKDEPIAANGKDAVIVEKNGIPGLICNSRFSIAFHMTPGQVKNGAILSNEAASTTRAGVLVHFREGHLRFTIISRWIAGVAMLETLKTFKPGQSVHIALSNDGTQRAQGMQIYIDGEIAQTRELYNTNSNAGSRKSKTPMKVGGSKHMKSWKGELRELRFYPERTLEPQEVKLIAQGKDDRRYFLEQSDTKYARIFARLEKAKLERQQYEDSLPTTMVMLERPKTEPTRLRIRGEYHNKGEEVTSGVPEVFPEMPASFPNNRLGFARWLVSGEHPLTARVAVNRYWQMLFGTGLVRTPEDFGTQGALPSHPELLDWLATYFVTQGWDVHAVLKKIVMSRTYRQSSKITPELLAKDPDNVWLARAPRMKLAGNILRDQALFSSGLLVEQQGGESVKPYQPARLWAEASNAKYVQQKGNNLYRRSLYTYWKRTLAPPSMAVLDTADREWCSVKPKRTNTPQQALTLMNETAFFEAARKLGERILREGGQDARSRVDFAFRTVLSRKANERELKILATAYANYLAECQKNPELAKEIQTVGESKVGGDVDPIELAAATAVANVIYNLEEASVKE